MDFHKISCDSGQGFKLRYPYPILSHKKFCKSPLITVFNNFDFMNFKTCNNFQDDEKLKRYSNFSDYISITPTLKTVT